MITFKEMLRDFSVKCDFCKQPLPSSHDPYQSYWGAFHEECKEAGEAEQKRLYKQVEMELALERLKQQKIDTKLIKRLRKTLKPKIMAGIDGELDNHCTGYYSIVSVGDCTGDRLKGWDYFGCSSAIKIVYDNVSSCSYTETYGGDIYIWIGKGRYLKMFISG